MQKWFRTLFLYFFLMRVAIAAYGSNMVVKMSNYAWRRDALESTLESQ